MTYVYFLHNAMGSMIDNYTCHGIVCHLKDYDPSEMPGGVTVYVNIKQNQALKKVDDKEMVLSLTPTVALAWKDPRIKVSRSFGVNKLLPDTILSKIWKTKLTVENRIDNGEGDADWDVGKLCKVF